MKKQKQPREYDAGFFSYLMGIILIVAIFIMGVTTVLSDDYQLRGQMRQCEETIKGETYYSPVCFFGDDYEYARMQ